MLPLSRNVTLTPSDPVPSALLNELQDSIVNGSHGDIPIPLPPEAATPWGSSWSFNGQLWVTDGALDLISFGITVPAGSLLVAVGLHYKRAAAAGSAGYTFAVVRRRFSVAGIDVEAEAALDTSSSTRVSRTIELVPPLEVDDDTTYAIAFTPATPGDEIYGASVTVRKP